MWRVDERHRQSGPVHDQLDRRVRSDADGRLVTSVTRSLKTGGCHGQAQHGRGDLVAIPLYRRAAVQDEFSNYGDRHEVGLYEVVKPAVVAEAQQPDISGYGQAPDMSYWAADSEGRIYYLACNAMGNTGWRRDDGEVYFSIVHERHARYINGAPITRGTPGMEG